uniref:DNA helicase n=1 Tax=Setaria digitata TaxID=48799 RepID=A0A915PK52_9BILA
MDMLLDFLADGISGNILIDNYMGHGLMVFDGNILWFIAGLYPGTDGKPYCKRRTKLCIDPALPFEEKFSAMFVNKNGSRVALSTAHSVFVVEIPYDCWCRQAVTRDPLMDHLQSTYHCKSYFVGCNVGSANSGVNILKIRWCSKERHECGHHAYNKLAVLSNGNIIRIYDTDITCATPTVIIDFKSMLGLSETSSARSFGLCNYIASFDFGPSFIRTDSDSGREISLRTLFAIDNECGEIYIVICSESRVIEVQGPLAVTGTGTSDYTCNDALDILYIQCHDKASLPVFSLISSKGCITHFFAVTLDQETFDGHMEFVLISYDNLLLPCKPLVDIVYCLQNDPAQSGQYFVLCGANLFTVDVRPWYHLLSYLLLSGANCEKDSNDFPDSKIHHIFRILGSTDSKGQQDAIIFATAANIVDEKFLTPDDINNAFDERDIVYVAATSSKQLVHKFTKQDAILNNRRGISERHSIPTERRIQNYLLEECLAILKSQTMIPTFRISEDIESLETINNNKSTCTERLLRVLSAYVDVKNRIYKIQRAVAQLKKRSDELGLGLIPRMFPLTDSEKALKDRLETLHVEVDGIIRQLPYLANEVAAKRRDRFGPTRSFCASVSAQKFMLSKNTEDINEMVSWTKQLIKKIDSIQASMTAEEAPSTSPKPRPQSD